MVRLPVSITKPEFIGCRAWLQQFPRPTHQPAAHAHRIVQQTTVGGIVLFTHIDTPQWLPTS